MLYHVHMTRLIQITAYVRDEADLAKWKALDNKTEWLHRMLAHTHTVEMLSGVPIEVHTDAPDGKAYLLNEHQLKTRPAIVEPTITPAEETL